MCDVLDILQVNRLKTRLECIKWIDIIKDISSGFEIEGKIQFDGIVQ
jgi:hypothetical protein